MTDIVERLRAEYREWGEVFHAEAADEIERLRTRLEINYAYQMVDGVMTKVQVEPGSIPDGIDCRNETIRLQDQTIDRLHAEIELMKAGHE